MQSRPSHEEILRFLNLSVELAREKMNSGFGGPFGALVVKNGVVLAEGYNCVTTKNDPTAHAEVQAIRAACEKLGSFQLEGCYVYSSCEPCPMCLGAIYWARPEAVYFAASRFDAAKAGFDDEFIYKEINLPLEQRSITMGHVEVKNHTAPFRDWIAKTDKIDY